MWFGVHFGGSIRAYMFHTSICGSPVQKSNVIPSCISSALLYLMHELNLQSAYEPRPYGSSAIQLFEGSDAIEICDRITFNFYTGLPHICSIRILNLPSCIARCRLLKAL